MQPLDEKITPKPEKRRVLQNTPAGTKSAKKKKTASNTAGKESLNIVTDNNNKNVSSGSSELQRPRDPIREILEGRVCTVLGLPDSFSFDELMEASGCKLVYEPERHAYVTFDTPAEARLCANKSVIIKNCLYYPSQIRRHTARCRIDTLARDVTRDDIMKSIKCSSAELRTSRDKRPERSNTHIVFGTAEDARMCSAKGCLLVQGKEYPVLIQNLQFYYSRRTCVIKELDADVTEEELKEVVFGCKEARIVTELYGTRLGYVEFLEMHEADTFSKCVCVQINEKDYQVQSYFEEIKGKTCVLLRLKFDAEDEATIKQEILQKYGCVSVAMPRNKAENERIVLLRFDTQEDAVACSKLGTLCVGDQNVSVIWDGAKNAEQICKISELDAEVTDEMLKQVSGCLFARISNHVIDQPLSAELIFSSPEKAVQCSKKGCLKMGEKEYPVELVTARELPKCFVQYPDSGISRKEIVDASNCISVFTRPFYDGKKAAIMTFDTVEAAEACVDNSVVLHGVTWPVQMYKDQSDGITAEKSRLVQLPSSQKVSKSSAD